MSTLPIGRMLYKSQLRTKYFSCTMQPKECNNIVIVHSKNGIVIMAYGLSFWLQMSEPITHMDTDNYITIHCKGTSYFDPVAYLMVLFTHLKGMVNYHSL